MKNPLFYLLAATVLVTAILIASHIVPNSLGGIIIFSSITGFFFMVPWKARLTNRYFGEKKSK
jgi:hypothetical protein